MDNSNLSIFSYNGNDITFNSGDGIMVNATEMAKPFGKRTNDWLSNQQTEELISTASSVTGIPATELVKIVQGGDPKQQGTWLHEDLALIFAQWLSPKFYLWCNDRIKELLRKGYVLANPNSMEYINEVVNLKVEKCQLTEKIASLNGTIAGLNGEIAELKSTIGDLHEKEQERRIKLLESTTQIFADNKLLQEQLAEKDSYLKNFFSRTHGVQVNYSYLLEIKRCAKDIRAMLNNISTMLDFPDPELPNLKRNNN